MSQLRTIGLLGKKQPRYDKRTLQFSNYLIAKALPPAPVRSHWDQKVKDWAMMLNNTIGDCTVASAGHMIQAWTSNVDLMNEIIVKDADVLKAYEDITGYDPSKPQTDTGAYLLDVLNYWRKTGIGGHKIAAYSMIDPTNFDHIKLGISMFGGVYIGLNLPLTAADQYQSGQPWSVVAGSIGKLGRGVAGSWGGHAVPLLGVDPFGLVCVTWGGVQRLSWNFMHYYCDEVYAPLSPDWIKDGRSPSNFDLATLQNDLSQL